MNRRKSVARKGDADGDELNEFGRPIDPSKIQLKPDDQLELTEAELKIEHTRILSARNPHAPDNLITFDFNAMNFTPGPAIEHMETNYKRLGTLIHVETDEAIAQMRDQSEEENLEESESKASVAGSNAGSQAASATGSSASVAQTEEKPAAKKKEKLIKNQFNYQDRGTQSAVQPPRGKAMQTDPPARIELSNQVSQDVIYDFYEKHMKALQAEKEKANTKQKGNEKENKNAKVANVEDKTELGAFTAKVVERMLNQNTYDQLADDFKYFDDPADGPDNAKGSLLPLWRFEYEKAKRLAVTSMVWCPQTQNDDLMVVAFGSYEFGKQSKGYLIFYSLKNPSYPESVVPCDCAIMSLDVNPKKGYLIACGLYDGSVSIFNVRENKHTYLFNSYPTKHSEPVWSIKWMENDVEDRLRFCSIAADGRVLMWTLSKNDLLPSTLLELKENDKHLSGISIDFHPTEKEKYICGTEEGKLFKCSTKYSSQYLDEFKAHDGAIMSIKWNQFHPDVFATSSQDWSLKIWSDKMGAAPLFSFDLGASVNDIDWAPYSSTIITAVTEGDNSKAYLYDLSINKNQPLCDQAVSQKKRTRLTKIKINPKHKIVIVGNDRGVVSSFKLSPNLRKVPVKSKKDPTPLPLDPQKEFEKLKKVLN